MFENMRYQTNGVAVLTGAIPASKKTARRRTHSVAMRAVDMRRIGAVFSGITILCIIKWMMVMLGTDIGSGIRLEEIVPLITAMISFAVAAICMIWR